MLSAPGPAALIEAMARVSSSGRCKPNHDRIIGSEDVRTEVLETIIVNRLVQDLDTDDIRNTSEGLHHERQAGDRFVHIQGGAEQLRLAI